MFRCRIILHNLYAFTLLHFAIYQLVLSVVLAAHQYELIPTGHCEASSSKFEYHGAISSNDCKNKCDETDSCLIYASKENEFCTVYEKCDVVPGTQWGGKFYRNKAAKRVKKTIDDYEIIPTGHCEPGSYQHTAYPGLSSHECVLKCDKDESCTIFYTKDSEFCTIYRKCTIVPGTQWGGMFYRKNRKIVSATNGLQGKLIS